MISVIDDGIGEIVQALRFKGMLDNTIILFYSDNGAPTAGLHSNKGSNYPFRGQKNSPWEGGSRVPAIIWHSSLANRRTYDQFMHVSDLLPTLAKATGVSLGSHLSKLDGIDQWQALKESSTTTNNQMMGVRKNMLYNIDEIFGYSAYMQDGWKIVIGTTLNGKYDYWMGDFIDPVEKMNETFYSKLITNSFVHKSMKDQKWLTYDEIIKRQKATEVNCNLQNNDETVCDPIKDPCLFNLLNDPCEYNNLADVNKKVVKQLLINVERYRLSALPIRNKHHDINANPMFHNNTWTYWQEKENGTPSHGKKYLQFSFLIISIVSTIAILIIFGFITITQKNKKNSQKMYIDNSKNIKHKEASSNVENNNEQQQQC